jgi:hypothetical protein
MECEVERLQKLFTAEHTWWGGYYELAIELGPRSDERLLTSLETIWASSSLEGCYLRRDIEPSLQERSSPTLSKLHHQGVATLPNGRQAACGTVIIREDRGIDWLDFYLPMCALDRAYENTPFREWREPFYGWLVQIAQAVFAVTMFPLGLIGHEVFGEQRSERVRVNGISKQRRYGCLWREGDRLVWYPPTGSASDQTVDL